MKYSTLHVFRARAVQLKVLRSAVLQNIFASAAPSGGGSDGPTVQALNDIANSFSRYAAYQQTAFDTGAARSTASSDATSMERLVQRALNQVLGRAPGSSAGSFINALNGAFPSVPSSEGQQVIFTPARSMLSLYQPGTYGSSYGNGAYPGASNGTYPTNGYGAMVPSTDGFGGTISARQANLLRQASVTSADALRLLEGLTPFVPEAETDQIDALRALIRSEVNALVDEFGRVDEPRKERVLAYFSALKIHVAGFGRRAFLDDPSRAVTVDDETQVAGFELLRSYTRTLREAWDTFYNVDALSPKSFSLSEREERANVLLPVVAQVNNDFQAAMDSVGFAESERRSLAARFDTLSGYKSFSLAQLKQNGAGALPPTPTQLFGNIDAFLPDFTVYDLTEWVDRFSSIEGPGILADSGQYGLDFVTDQADRLFWVVVPVVAHLELNDVTSPGASPSLEQILSNERVHFALNNLLGQLNSLADLSVPGGKENLLIA
jgi:hypothetical protein